MKKKWLKKGSAVLLSLTMALSLFPGMNGTIPTVQAAENTTPAKEYWTDVDGLKGFSLSNTSTTVGKIRFGLNGSDSRLWAICGADGDNLALLSTSEFARAAYGSTSKYSESNFVTKLTTTLGDYLSTSYFSSTELGKMADVTVTTNEPDGSGGYSPVEVKNTKLYLPNSQDQNSPAQKKIYVGSGNNIAIDLKKLTDTNGFQTNSFWLRSPGDANRSSVLLACPGNFVNYGSSVDNSKVSVVPAFNLNLSSDIFASASEAASSSYTGYKANDTDNTMTANTYTLRYRYTTGTDSAVISSDGKKVTVTNAKGKYLMVQNSAGVYAMAIDSDSKTVNASAITMGSALGNFNNCKVWIESTNDRITTAKMATQATVTTINSIEITDITPPVAGSAFDTEAACATTSISTTPPTVIWTQGGESVTGNAGYNTTYTASVTLAAAENYEFASGVTATVNGQNATSVTKNQDGTVIVTYEFPATAKAKLTSITAPTGITVANGTDYAAMGLPTSVAIITEGNTETTAAVTWDTTTPASGSYDPRVLTEQSVTLNGTVTCPSNIDQNGVALTTTITVKISAAAPNTYAVTVNNGTGDGSYAAGATVTIKADAAPSGQEFDTWTVVSGGVTLASATNATTTFVMPASAVEVTATYKNKASEPNPPAPAPEPTPNPPAPTPEPEPTPTPAPSTYAVTVNNGTGGGSYAAGETVTITADAAPSGQEFDTWTVVSGGVTLASATSTTTTFKMPASAVEVTATYKNKASEPNPPAPTPAPAPAPTPTYTITTGAGGTYELSTDGTLTITCDGALDKLTGIYVNDKLVDAANYTLRSGSTILTFKASYLNTLSVGTYKVKFQYSDESAETTFVIKEASVKDTSTQDTTTQDTSTQDTTTQDTTTQNTTAPSKKDDVPKTGDNTPIAWLFMIAVISGAGVCYFGRKKKTVK